MEVTDPDRLDVEIGARVRAFRTLRGLSQTQLADSISISFHQIRRYELGASRLNASTLVLIARALDVSPGDLLGIGGHALPEIDWTHLFVDGALELVRAVSQIRSAELRRKVMRLAQELASARNLN